MKSLVEFINESITLKPENVRTKEMKSFVKTLRNEKCLIDKEEDNENIWTIYSRYAKLIDGVLIPSVTININNDNTFCPWFSKDDSVITCDIENDEKDTMSLIEFDKKDDTHILFSDKNAQLIAELINRNK